MTSQKLKLDPLQDTRIKKALQNHKGVCLTVAPAAQDTEDSNDTGAWLLSPRQMQKLAHGNGGPVKLTFSNAQLHQNLHHTGGFLPLLAAAILPIIGSAIGGVVEREIAKGGGLHSPVDGGQMPVHDHEQLLGSSSHGGAPLVHHTPSGTVEIIPQGSGLYLNPYMGRRPRGYGLYGVGGQRVGRGDLTRGWTQRHRRLLKTIL